MHITLSKELERFVQEEVRLGRYNDADELIAEALRLLKQRQDLVRELDNTIEEGLADAAAGRVHTPDEVREYLRQRRAQRAALTK